MKCAILAAGRGVRLKPITDKIPKVLVEINGKPFLSYVINNVLEADFKDIALVIGYRGNQIKQFMIDTYPNLDVTYVEQSEQRGTAHAVSLLEEWSGEDNFVVLVGDGLISVRDLKLFRDTPNQYHQMLIFEGVNNGQYGEVHESHDGNRGFLEKMIEKPKVSTSNLISPGAYYFTPAIYSRIEELNYSSRGELEIPGALKKNQVEVHHMKDRWIELEKEL